MYIYIHPIYSHAYIHPIYSHHVNSVTYIEYHEKKIQYSQIKENDSSEYNKKPKIFREIPMH